MTLIARSLPRYILAAAALVAAFYSALFARASYLFHKDTADSVAAAVRLVPYNSSYVSHLAAWQPERKTELLHRAVELNPFEAEAWIQLGVIAEMEQCDIATAERYYLEAARVDHMFLPKWTLANFYFRRQKEQEFFRWAKAALEITPYAPEPLFAQMWWMSHDAQKIAQAVPDRPGILLQYSGFLTAAHQCAAIPAVVHRLLALAGHANPADYGRDDQIGPIEDRLLAAGEIDAALQVWRTLKEANWVSLPAPTPAAPLSNGDFRAPFFRHGFDWIPVPSAGVTFDQDPDQKSISITFSGDQPERCVLLQQYIPLEPSRSYRLSWQADGQGVTKPSGLVWHIGPTAGSSDDLLGEAHRQWEFQAPGAKVSLLTLEYSRALGSTRISGTVRLHSVSLKDFNQ